MTEPVLSPAIPILRIYDIAKAKEFYVDFLGFKIDWGTGSTTTRHSTCRSRVPA